MGLFGNKESGAEFSHNGNYRYKLWRVWDDSKPVAMCIGLNPSTANADKSDPTILNLSKALVKLGYGGFYMTNLFAWISSKPDDLLSVKDPLGDNDRALVNVRKKCDDVIVCWGTFKQAEDRIKEVLPRFPEALCFGKNQNGSPKHPLSLMYSGTVNNPILIPFN